MALGVGCSTNVGAEFQTAITEFYLWVVKARVPAGKKAVGLSLDRTLQIAKLVKDNPMDPVVVDTSTGSLKLLFLHYLSTK